MEKNRKKHVKSQDLILLEGAIKNLYDFTCSNLNDLNEIYTDSIFIKDRIADFASLTQKIDCAIGILDDHLLELDNRITMLEDKEFTKNFDCLSKKIEKIIREFSGEINENWKKIIKERENRRSCLNNDISVVVE